MNKRKKLLSVLLAALIIVGAAGTVFGAGNYVTKKIWQGPLTMYKNSQPVQLAANPIIMDGTTYVPIRALAQLMGMNITWDNASRSIFISDNTQANMAYYAQLIAANEAQAKEYKAQIEKLESEKKELQKKLDEANKKLNDRRDDRDYYGLENTLNRSYRDATIDGQRLSFDYKLRETYRNSHDRYSLVIEMDVWGNYKNYSLKKSSDFINFLERDVAYEARKYYRDYRGRYAYDYIEIVVTDREFRENNCSFSVDSDGRVR